MKKLALVIDCGATNVRAASVDMKGRIVHAESRPNSPKRQKPGRDWLIWDFECIWDSMLACAASVVHRSGRDTFAALAVTSFSDDGAPVDDKGNMLYPVISWQCLCTKEIAENAGAIIDLKALFGICGEQPAYQHTLFRLLWLRDNCPEIFGKMRKFVMFPGLVNYRLTGETVNDPTIGDSMMLLDIKKRDYSGSLLSLTGLDRSYFPPMVEPGSVIGMLNVSIAKKIGLKKSIPVVAAGHDTQFAIYGSGCKEGEAALSSGTWEILFFRLRSPVLSSRAFREGIKNECDAVPGLYNVGQQWIGSGVLEWLNSLWGRNGDYSSMQRMAGRVAPGCGGVMMEPSLIPGKDQLSGSIVGLNLLSGRRDIYRAALEGLSYKLRRSLETIEAVAGVRIPSLIIAGGGSKNKLWNRIRADVLGRPVITTSQKENTVIGAAIFAFTGAGLYRTVDEARENFSFKYDVIETGRDRDRYDELYHIYCKVHSRTSSISGMLSTVK